MSDLLCVPCRSGSQVGISERRKLRRPGGAHRAGRNKGQPQLTDKLENLPPRRGTKSGQVRKLAATWENRTRGSRDRRSWRRRGGCPTCCACHAARGRKSESPSDGSFVVPAVGTERAEIRGSLNSRTSWKTCRHGASQKRSSSKTCRHVGEPKAGKLENLPPRSNSPPE